MLVSDLVFEVRNASLARVGLLTPDDGLTTFKATLRLNNVGSWEITIPENRPLADALRAPGAGLIVTGPNGVIMSGPTVAATKTNESGSPIGSWLIRGADDSVVLGERLAYPTPSTADVTLQTSAYDSVSAVKASTAMLGYVTRNIGSSAPAARKISSLTTVTDPVVGSNISYAARFDVLGQVLTDIAGVDGLAFDMYQSGSSILFNVWAPADKSKSIRLDVANNTLQKSAYGYSYGVSRAIVAGQGVGAARTFTEVTTSDSLLTESSFGRRVERFVDQRDESDSAKLVTSGKSTLADAGGLVTSVDVVPSNDSTMRPLVDFNLGDKVSVVVASQEVAAVITQMSLSITDVGVYVGITVGDAVGVDFEAITAKRQTDATASIATLNAKEQILPAGSISGSQLADSSVTSAKIVDGTIVNADINASAAIDPTKVAGTAAVLTGASFSGQVSVPQSTSVGSNGINLNAAGSGYIKGTPNDTWSWQTANVQIQSWQSIGFGPSISGQSVPQGENAVIINTRTGEMQARANIYSTGGHVYGPYNPYSVAAGSVNVTGNNTPQVAVGVTFPGGRFSATPIVTSSMNNASAYTVVTAPVSASTSGFTMWARHVDNTNWASGPFNVGWIAVQM